MARAFIVAIFITVGFCVANGDVNATGMKEELLQEIADNTDNLNSILYMLSGHDVHDKFNIIRLSGGSSSREGRVEILHNGEWGTVCGNSWGEDDARVICRQLGLPIENPIPTSGEFGEGTGPIWLDEVSCAGSESSIRSCPHALWEVNTCTHAQDAGVNCSEPLIRLYHDENHDGPEPDHGRIEIRRYYEPSGEELWGTVCDDNFVTTNGANVVCKQLGFQRGTFYGGSHYGQGTGPIWLDYVRCTGSESHLWDCPHYGWGKSRNCNHGEDVGVQCFY